MDDKQRKKLEELEDRTIDQVARSLISLSREFIRKEDAGDKEIIDFLQELRSNEHNKDD